MCGACRIGIIWLLPWLVFALIPYSSQRNKTSKPEQVTQQIDGYEVDGEDFTATIYNLCQKYGLRWGLDLEVPPERQLISVRVSKGTVADVLDTVLAQEPNYEWAEVNGVVNVMPKQRSNSLLNLQIANFHIRNANFFAIQPAIVSLPELKAWRARNHITEQDIFNDDIATSPVGTKNGYTLPRISLDLGHATVQEILNRIVKARRFRWWYVHRFGHNGQYLGLAVN